jgi:predicted lipid-binding transport protein (Tim44 family)
MIQSAVLPEAASATCLNCGAALAPDQRYCLSCGQPCSPVRLAFLDVLQSERPVGQPISAAAAPGAYQPWEQVGTGGPLQRYSGVFGLLTVLLVAGLIGLLVGHWISAGNTPAQSSLKIEGLSGLAAAAPTASTAAPSTPTTSTPKSASTPKAKEASEEGSVAAEEAAAKVPPKAPKKTSSSTLSKLKNLKGKKYEQEINKLASGDQPIETGGG